MDIIMPKMGESVNEGTIIKWHKKQGDTVKRDEIIFEISTDKVDTEIPSPADGILSAINVNEGETVEVGTVVAIINEVGSAPQSETVHSEPAPAPKSETKQTAPPPSPPQPQTKTPKSASPAPETPKSNNSVGENLIDIEMPKMGESVMEGTIIKWHKKVGDRVQKDEPLFEISTDKVDTEIPSPAEGTLAEVMVGEQETVEVGTLVARLASDKPAATRSAGTKPTPQSASKDFNISAPAPQPAAMQDNSASPAHTFEEKEELGFLSPLVLNIAKNEKVSSEELKTIKGTGLQGRITKKDILLYIDRRKEQKIEPEKLSSGQQTILKEKKTGVPSAPGYSVPSMSAVSSGDVEVIPMDNIRQKIMQHMINSRDTSVHVTALIEVDMVKIHTFIQNHKNDFMEKEGIKLTYMPFITDAVIKALKEYPLINSTIDGTTIYKKKYINLGIAVAMEPNGLIVPNIKKAGEKNLIGLAKAINELATNARTKKLTPDDISHGTFTITNYGVFGTIFGTPIINQPEVAILGVGAVIKKPVAVDIDGNDSITVRPIMALTLAHDHRIIDGMLGGKFLKFVKDVLESFEPDNL
jgi:2-oxoglutarate dehydrogenase E2 component (dihydrolipoamide succinyltransferase)